MTELSEDREIFMRSMASRGSLGGMAAATEEALDLLDAAGFTYLLVETVGVGQVELDIAQATDTVVVVLVPESGDGIQAMKAGLMEIGDLFVVNKADREGADRLQGELESMLDYRPRRDAWRPRVLATAAHKDVGVLALMDAVARHREHMERTGALAGRRRETLKLRLLGEAKRALLDRLETGESAELETILDRLARRELTPHDAARDIVDRLARSAETTAPSESEP
jgi:LAO/AO transport system kinase